MIDPVVFPTGLVGLSMFGDDGEFEACFPQKLSYQSVSTADGRGSGHPNTKYQLFTANQATTRYIS